MNKKEFIEEKTKGFESMGAFKKGLEDLLSECLDTATTICKNEMSCDFVDLGLPSGIKWAKSNIGTTNPKKPGTLFKNYNKMIKKCELPDAYDFKELIEQCKWEFKDNGYEVTGPNGNSIFFVNTDSETGHYATSDYCEGVIKYLFLSESNYWIAQSFVGIVSLAIRPVKRP